MKILCLNEKQILDVFNMKDAIKADKDALIAYSKNETDIPLRVNIDVPKHAGQSLYMPGYVEGANALGIKIVSVYPENLAKNLPSVPATMVLIDSATGMVCALMDGTTLTRIRTGAVSGAATELLSNKNAKKMALFGTGGQAATQLEAVLNVRDIEEVLVFGLNDEQNESFAKAMTDKFAGKFKAKISAAKSAAEAVENADIITAVTTSKKPVFDGNLVKKGAHINGVGSYTHEMNEIDEVLLLRADKVFVDTRDGCIAEAGDLIIPVEKGNYSFDRINGELGELLQGQMPGRENEDEITFFKTVGSAVLDVLTAQRIYENAIEKNVGSWIEL